MMSDFVRVTLDLAAVAMALPAVGLATQVWKLRSQQVRVCRERQGEGYAEFAAAFTGANPNLLHAVYQTLQQMALAPGMPVRAGDSLERMYGIGQFAGTRASEVCEWIGGLAGVSRVAAPGAIEPATVADLVDALAAPNPVQASRRRVIQPAARTRVALVANR
ncbi:MAG: hypothetical protein KGJ62_11810 [Armatimonadetes bacterium]|nr:hypothetical protein [Armatimonadota bacterium]MDE2207796.1 hypothetical protein [Armatimonadota bacterium]